MHTVINNFTQHNSQQTDKIFIWTIISGPGNWFLTCKFPLDDPRYLPVFCNLDDAQTAVKKAVKISEETRMTVLLKEFKFDYVWMEVNQREGSVLDL